MTLIFFYLLFTFYFILFKVLSRENYQQKLDKLFSNITCVYKSPKEKYFHTLILQYL